MNTIARFASAKVAVSALDAEKSVGFIEKSWRDIFKETESSDKADPVFEVRIRAAANELSLNIDETVKIVNALLVY
jgi:hypothetical protein